MSDAVAMVITCALRQGGNDPSMRQLFGEAEFARLVERQKAALLDRLLVKECGDPPRLASAP